MMTVAEFTKQIRQHTDPIGDIANIMDSLATSNISGGAEIRPGGIAWLAQRLLELQEGVDEVLQRIAMDKGG